MEPINVNLSCDIQQPVKVRYLDGYFFSKDSAGHRINVDVFDNGAPVSVGGSVSAEVVRSDGETVPVTGAVSANRAYVILPQAAYAVVGAVQITIKVTEGTTIVTIACFVAYVHESDTDITVDPGTIIPSVQALISQIETAVASIPADYSSLWTSLAPAFSTSTPYAVGQYVTNSGMLYRFTTAHPAGTWNSAHVTAVNLGAEVYNLKSAFEMIGNEDNALDLSNYPIFNCTVRDSNLLTVSGTSYQSVQIPTLNRFDRVTIKASSEKAAIVCLFKISLPATVTNGMNVTSYFATGETARHSISAGETATLNIPSDTAYILIGTLSNNASIAPESVTVHNKITNIPSESTIASLSSVSGGDLKSFLTIDGAVYKSDGKDYNTDEINKLYCKTPYIFVSEGTKLAAYGIYALVPIAMLAVYNLEKEYDTNASKAGNGADVKNNFTFVMPYDGYVRYSTKKSTLDNTRIHNVSTLKNLNILVLGNSFSQDSFAYLPPVLNELLPEYQITYGVAYSGSAGVQDHVDMYNEGTAYTWFNIWKPGSTMWTRYAGGGGANEKTLADIVEMAQWDIIYTQPNGYLDDIVENAVVPGRKLLRLLNTIIDRQFVFMMGQWLTANEYVPDMAQAMNTIKTSLGVNHIVPIGTGIANARTNETLNALGENGRMLYDGNHQQSGIPALISTYVLANFILRMLGFSNRSVYNSSFVPTTENCIAINAYKEEGMVTPLPMTHGESVGVTTANIRAAQEIAALAVNNPFVISDCSDILS